MSSRTRNVEDKKLLARAFDDAMRDILRSDGVFKLADHRSQDAIWEFDGLAWKRVELGRHAEEELRLDPIADEAVASAG